MGIKAPYPPSPYPPKGPYDIMTLLMAMAATTTLMVASIAFSINLRVHAATAIIITYTIFFGGVPYYKYSIRYPQTHSKY